MVLIESDEIEGGSSHGVYLYVRDPVGTNPIALRGVSYAISAGKIGPSLGTRFDLLCFALRCDIDCPGAKGKAMRQRQPANKYRLVGTLQRMLMQIAQHDTSTWLSRLG